MVDRHPAYILVHSPLVVGSTWTLVAEEMRLRGLDMLVPILNDSPESTEPFWKQHADSVLSAVTTIHKNVPVMLVAHSGAGPLLPAIRDAIPNPVRTYVFVDAGVPRDGATRLDLMKSEDLNWANEFQQFLENGGTFPNWSSDDLAAIIPDEKTRDQLVAELRPRGLDFFSEPIPVFAGWPDAPCVYIQLSEAYDWDAAQANEWGWSTYKVEAGHFHMLVDPEEVTRLIVNAVNKLH